MVQLASLSSDMFIAAAEEDPDYQHVHTAVDRECSGQIVEITLFASKLDINYWSGTSTVIISGLVHQYSGNCIDYTNYVCYANNVSYHTVKQISDVNVYCHVRNTLQDFKIKYKIKTG